MTKIILVLVESGQMEKTFGIEGVSDQGQTSVHFVGNRWIMEILKI